MHNHYFLCYDFDGRSFVSFFFYRCLFYQIFKLQIGHQWMFFHRHIPIICFQSRNQRLNFWIFEFFRQCENRVSLFPQKIYDLFTKISLLLASVVIFSLSNATLLNLQCKLQNHHQNHNEAVQNFMTLDCFTYNFSIG